MSFESMWNAMVIAAYLVLAERKLGKYTIYTDFIYENVFISISLTINSLVN